MGDWIYYRRASHISIYTCMFIALYGLVVALCSNPINWYGIVIASLFILYDIVFFFKHARHFLCCTRMVTRIFMRCGIFSVMLGIILACFFKEGFLNSWSIGAFSSGVIYLAITARLYDRPEHYWISKTFSKCQFLALFYSLTFLLK